MKTPSRFFLLFASLTWAISIHAQDLNHVEENPAKQPKEANELTKAMSLFGQVNVQESYVFSSNMKMQIESTDKKRKTTTQSMIMYLSENQEYLGLKLLDDKSGLDYMIVDLNKKQMITMLTNSGQKMGMVTKYEEEIKNSQDQVIHTFEKTGRTETIFGRYSEEYLVKSSDPDETNRMTIWMSEEGDNYWMEAMKRLGKQKNSNWSGRIPVNYPEGGLVRVVNEDKEGTATMTVIENNPNQTTTVKTEGYMFMNVGG